MKNSILLLFALFIVFVPGACSGGEDASIRQASSLIIGQPDSALAIIGSIDPSALSSGRQRAEYSLVLAMALDRCHLDTAGVHLLDPAISWYPVHGPAEKTAACWYYLGRIQMHSGLRKEAQESFSKALDCSEGIDDDLLLMKLYAQLSALYSSDNNLEDAHRYIVMARESASRTTDSLGIWILQAREATSLSNLGDYAGADSLFREFFSQPVRDSSVRGRFLLNYAKTLLRKKPSEPGRSAEAFEEALAAGCKPSVDNCCVYAMACELTGRSRDVDRMMQQLDASSPGGRNAGIVKLYKYRILKNRGESAAALQMYEEAVAVSDSIVRNTLRQSLQRSREEYMSAKAEMIRRQGRERLLYSIAAALLVLIVLSGLMFSHQHHRREELRAREEELQALRDDTGRLLALEKSKDDTITRLRSGYVSMYKGQFKLLDNLCATYWSPGRVDTKEKIYGEVRQALSVISSDADGQKRLEAMIDRDLDGIMTKLRADLPGRSDDDFRFIAYLIIGLSPKTIASILNCVPGSVYNRKMRLKERLSRLDSPYRDLYLSFII